MDIARVALFSNYSKTVALELSKSHFAYSIAAEMF